MSYPTRAELTNRLSSLSHVFDEIRDRIVTIADEAFGPFPAQTADEAMTAIERGIFGMRQALSAETIATNKARAERDELIEATILGPLKGRTAHDEINRMRLVYEAAIIWRRSWPSSKYEWDLRTAVDLAIASEPK